MVYATETGTENVFGKRRESPEDFDGYEGYTTKQIQRMTHIEHFGKREDGTDIFIWFDYLNRDPLTYKSRTEEVELW